jgi:site-specific DNA-methyltransferase (adenine-specific)
MNDIELWQGDCLELMDNIQDNSIDMILADLPYGSTNCAWDSPINLIELWKQYRRIIKLYHAIVMFSSQPFTSILGASNIEWLKYSWVWEKNRSTGHVHSKNKPMKRHEDILVFSEGNTLHAGQSKKRMPYYPQGLVKLEDGTKRRTRHDAGDEAVMGKRKSHKETIWTHTNYPTTILKFDIEMNEKRFHETQKPVDLCEYLINTYSLNGELVLDNVMGSGSSGVAAKKLNRKFIGIEKELNFFDIAKDRIEKY